MRDKIRAVGVTQPALTYTNPVFMHLPLNLILLSHSSYLVVFDLTATYTPRRKQASKKLLTSAKSFGVTSAQRLRYLVSVPNRPVATYWAESIQFLCCPAHGWQSLMYAVQPNRNQSICSFHFLRRFKIKQREARSKGGKNYFSLQFITDILLWHPSLWSAFKYSSTVGCQ